MVFILNEFKISIILIVHFSKTDKKSNGGKSSDGNGRLLPLVPLFLSSCLSHEV